ncbi:hypothetical protein [Pontibacter russatus]|uniref:hypothetical protein n=1 Tax=Pontibacter russatus TaxID=2694929 RepID=UPI00137AD385|nr:hypothetical protein [Pontibacter russatus]
MEMRNKKLMAVCALLLVALSASAQKGAPRVATPPLDQMTNQVTGVVRNDNITEMADKSAVVEGSVYLNDEWRQGSLYTSAGQVLENIPIKYDIRHDVMEVKTEDGVKVLSGMYIKRFEWVDKENQEKALFLNCKDFGLNERIYAGFFRVVVPGAKVQLLSHTELQVQEANYTPILDVGDKKAEILKKEKFYISDGKQVLELKDKNAFKIFGPEEGEMKQYAKKSRLKISKRNDAALLLAHYNTKH